MPESVNIAFVRCIVASWLPAEITAGDEVCGLLQALASPSLRGACRRSSHNWSEPTFFESRYGGIRRRHDGGRSGHMVDDQQVPKSWFLQYRALTRPVVGHSLRQRPAKVLIAGAAISWLRFQIGCDRFAGE
ncbi:hypothetical protein B0H14DRAFT_159088 [Mycena olivaceomarginata]|nr:hypothetical protein B0H14DRAFT_159088 [Mycena olivaceomarginata]